LSRQTRANEILLKNSNANREQVKTNGRTWKYKEICLRKFL
jgi:hypothetical protein